MLFKWFFFCTWNYYYSVFAAQLCPDTLDTKDRFFFFQKRNDYQNIWNYIKKEILGTLFFLWNIWPARVLLFERGRIRRQKVQQTAHGSRVTRFINFEQSGRLYKRRTFNCPCRNKTRKKKNPPFFSAGDASTRNVYGFLSTLLRARERKSRGGRGEGRWTHPINNVFRGARAIDVR